MKKILILLFTQLLLLGSITSYAQQHLPNPERGFRYEAMAKIPSLTFPWDSTRKLNTARWLTDLESLYSATDKHIRLSQLYLYLSDFAGTDTLSVAAIDSVAAVLNGVRSQGYKVVLRLAYTYDGTGGYVYPPMSRILLHLDQLKTTLRNHIDVIHVMQAGIIGLWGEWHNYNNAYTNTDKTNLLKKILEVLPQGRHTQLRLPGYKNDASLTSSETVRVGYANDFFTDDQHVNAYNWGYLSSPVYTQVTEESPHVLVDGEMPYEGPEPANYLMYALDPIKSIRQFTDHHYTSFSVVHNYPLTIDSWKSANITKAQMDANGFSYDPAYFNSGSRKVYDYIADHLGYRLWLDYSASNIIEDDSLINCSLAIRNVGFAAIHNPRQVFLVLTESNGTLVDTIRLSNQPSGWHTGTTQTLQATFQKPTGLTNYKIGIWMPDYDGSATRLDPRYAIRYSNLSWLTRGLSAGDSLGINVLHMDSVRKISYCAATGDMDPGNRFIQSLSTAGASKNINFSNTTFPDSGYLKYAGARIAAPRGSNFTVTMQNAPETKWSRVAVWIDWNNDGDFTDSGEQVIARGAAASDNSATVLNFTETISVPENAVPGTVGMRVRLYDAWLPNPGPCGFADNSGNFDFFIDVLQETMQEYCAAPGDTDPSDRYIESLSTSGAREDMSFAGSGYPAGGYLQFTTQKATVETGSSFTLNCTNSTNTKWSRVIAWIDWNKDGIFSDSTERIFYLGSAASDNSASVHSIAQNITVPAGAALGTTAMRIRFHDAWLPTAAPCGYEDNSSTFDFLLQVVEASARAAGPGRENNQQPVHTKPNPTCKLYPNPAGEWLHISSVESLKNIRILNLAGQELIRTSATAKLLPKINIAKLPRGGYVAVLYLANGQRKSIRFIKQ